MKKMIIAWTTVAVLIAGISGGLVLYKNAEIKAAQAAASAMPEPAEAVASVRVRQGQWSATTRAIGTVVAKRQLEIRTELAGTVTQLGFASGDTVSAGQLLIQFDTRQEQASLEAARAEALLAQQTLERRESLRASAAFSGQEADKARAEFAAATARVRGLEVAIAKKRIVAPFPARIGITDLQPGAYLDAGAVIGRLQGIDDDAYVDFMLAQEAAAAVRPGATVRLVGPALENGRAGEADGGVAASVIAEDDSADRSNRSVRFRAVVGGYGTKLRPGAYVDVIAVTSQPRDVLLVPLAAVRRSPSGQHVFALVERNGGLRAELRPVRTSAVQGDEIVIEAGLSPGDLIATAGSFKLRPGLLVRSQAPPEATRAN